MDGPELDVVTGAFTYTGKYIARRLLSTGRRVRTLTGHPRRPHPFGDRVSVAPLDFGDPRRLTESLRGAATLYNTYWVRFPRRPATFEEAVANTQTLIRAAEEAGVRRIVHISVTNPSEDSPLPYFRGKAALEKAVMGSKPSYAIVRPTVVFGTGDILINNIAWLLRRFPVFVVPGSGDYRLQPVFVDDVAAIAVAAGRKDESLVVDAAGPEVYTFEDLVRLIAAKIGRRPRIVHLSPALAIPLITSIGLLVRDVVLTAEELDGLMAELVVSHGPPTGQTRLSDWLERNAASVGGEYASELARHFR